MFNAAEGLRELTERIPVYAFLAYCIYKCVRTAQQPETHKASVYALILCFSGWFLTITTPIMRAFCDYNDVGERIATINIGAAITVFALATIIGVFAIWQIRRERILRSRGTAQAILAVLLSLPILVFVLVPVLVWLLTTGHI